MRLSRSQGRSIRSTDAAPYDLAGGPDDTTYSLYRAAGAIGVCRLVSYTMTSEAATTRPGMEVVVAAASANVTGLVYAAPRGVYEGNGGSGAINTALTYNGATTTPVPGRAAVTGDVIEVLRDGSGFIFWGDQTTNGASSAVIGDVLGVSTNSTALADGQVQKLATQGAGIFLAKITALEGSTVTATTGTGNALKVLVHFG